MYTPQQEIPLQLEFIKELKSKFDEYSGNNILIGADLNTFLNPVLDKKEGTNITKTEYTKWYV